MRYVNPLLKVAVLMQFSNALMTVVNKATRLLLELAVLCYPRYEVRTNFYESCSFRFLYCKHNVKTKFSWQIWWNVSGFNFKYSIVMVSANLIGEESWNNSHLLCG